MQLNKSTNLSSSSTASQISLLELSNDSHFPFLSFKFFNLFRQTLVPINRVIYLLNLIESKKRSSIPSSHFATAPEKKRSKSASHFIQNRFPTFTSSLVPSTIFLFPLPFFNANAIATCVYSISIEAVAERFTSRPLFCFLFCYFPLIERGSRFRLCPPNSFP